MQFSRHGNLSLEMTNGRPLCPKCKAPMWIIRIHPERAANKGRTFQCPRCEYMDVQFFTRVGKDNDS
jgi:hypothetical protein